MVRSLSINDLEIISSAALGVSIRGIVEFLDDKVSLTQDTAVCYLSSRFKDVELSTLKTLQFLFLGFVDTHIHAS